MEDQPMQPMITSEAARALRCSESTVRALEREGQLQAVRTPGGMRIFDRQQVEALARARESR